MKSATGWQPFDGREGMDSMRQRQLGEAVKDDRDRAVGIVRHETGRGPRPALRHAGGESGGPAVRGRVVNVDATWQEAVGYIAVAGALGTHAREVQCDNNLQAETLALLLALEVAEGLEGHPPPLIFRTDCEALVLAVANRRGNGLRDKRLGQLATMAVRTLSHRRQWDLVQVPRVKVRDAHAAAGKARRGVIPAPLWLPT